MYHPGNVLAFNNAYRAYVIPDLIVCPGKLKGAANNGLDQEEV
jgi:hypothetical protein